MADDMIDNPDTLCRRLAEACGAAGLTAEQLDARRVRVGVTGAGMLAEVIRCMPGSDEALYWYWSWDEPICPGRRHLPRDENDRLRRHSRECVISNSRHYPAECTRPRDAVTGKSVEAPSRRRVPSGYVRDQGMS
jgi:hypothetical protein